MKKFLAILFLVLAFTLLLSACGNRNVSETDATSETEEHQTEAPAKRADITAECVVKKGNRYVIVLPNSNYSIPVGSAYVKYLSLVTDELVLAAETKITDEVKALGEEPQWSIESYDGNEMCLVVEVIKFVEGADYMEEAGCGIDHEHIILAESIIDKAQ